MHLCTTCGLIIAKRLKEACVGLLLGGFLIKHDEGRALYKNQSIMAGAGRVYLMKGEREPEEKVNRHRSKE